MEKFILMLITNVLMVLTLVSASLTLYAVVLLYEYRHYLNSTLVIVTVCGVLMTLCATKLYRDCRYVLINCKTFTNSSSDDVL